jgi:hypothetical protein
VGEIGKLMSETSPRDQAALLFNAKQKAARLPRPGEEVWRLRHAGGRVKRCELRDDAQSGAGDAASGRRAVVLATLRGWSPCAVRRDEHAKRSAAHRLGKSRMNQQARSDFGRDKARPNKPCKHLIGNELDGGEGRNRTVDTTIFSRMLYQLSYLATRGIARTTEPKS